MKQSRLVLALVVATALAACGKKGGDEGADSCEKIGERFAALAHAEADNLADDHPQKAEAMALLAVLPKARASVVKECRDEKWSATIRKCFVEAKSAAEFRESCKDLMEGGTAAKPAAGDPPADDSADEPAGDQPADDATDDQPAGDEAAGGEPAADDDTTDGAD